VNLWRLQALVNLATVFLPIILLGVGLVASFLGSGAVLIAAMCAAAALIMLVLVLQVGVSPPLSWDRFRYALREHDLWISRGVLFRQQTVIPLSRIQHVDTRQGPIERLFGLSRLLVFTASGLAPDGGIPGLATATARQLRDDLARRGGEDGL